MADAAGGRYAVIVQNDAGKDEISDIKLMEGVEPEINVDADVKVEKADAGWKIGMVRGGSVQSVAGFGFENELAAAGRSDSGVTRMADAKLTKKVNVPTNIDPTALPPVSHEKQRGTGEAQQVSEPAKPARTAKRPSRKKKAA